VRPTHGLAVAEAIRVLSSTLTLPRLLLLVVLGCAGLIWTVAGAREVHRPPAVARLDNPFSMWGMLSRVGCSAPNERGSFIVGKALPDEAGNPYIFECMGDRLVLDGRTLR
jgi:hypothetical protein